MDAELRLLRSFAVLAEELHFGRAAARLYVSQPALSRQILALERSWGSSLFVRDSRSVVLSDPGRRLLPHVRDVLERADRLSAVALRLQRAGIAALSVGFVGQALNELTPVVLSAFGRRRPDVQLHIRQVGPGELPVVVRRGEVDVAIARLPFRLDGLRHEPLFSEPRVAVLPSDHPLAIRESLAIADLLDEVWVVNSFADPDYQAFALALRDRGGNPPIVGPTVTTIDEYLECVLAHRGIGLAPASAARYYSRPGVTYVPVPDAEPSVVAIVWSQLDRRLSNAALAFRDLVRETVQTQPEPAAERLLDVNVLAPTSGPGSTGTG